MAAIHPIRAGVASGATLGGLHAVWALMVALGWAQPAADFLFRIHFIEPIYVITPFQLGMAVLLVAITAAVGFVAGWAFGFIWNRTR